MQLADTSALSVPPPVLDEGALGVTPVAAPIPPVTSAASETAALATGINAGTAAKPDPLSLPETRGPCPWQQKLSRLCGQMQLWEALAPTSTKDILSAQWPQMQDDQRQVATTKLETAIQVLLMLNLQISSSRTNGQAKVAKHAF